jgi:hypothetical protein
MILPPPTREDWKIAEVFVNTETLFVLWAVKTEFCTRSVDFQKNYGDELPFDALIQSLEMDEFLQADGEELVLS